MRVDEKIIDEALTGSAETRHVYRKESDDYDGSGVDHNIGFYGFYKGDPICIDYCAVDGRRVYLGNG